MPTRTEARLASLGTTSFLRFWCHPHPFFAPGEELCDLLGVFGDDVFVFSDKERVLDPSKADDDDAWRRWQRLAVTKSIEATFKAERRLKRGLPVFSDSKARNPLPVALPPPSRMRLHRIAVANGAAAACRSARGGRGSLFLSTDPTAVKQRFAVYALNTEGGLVHVFDEVSLPIVLGELDTMPEFRNYLLCKEEVVTRGVHISCVAEEDLLARYLQQPHHADAQRHGFGSLDGVTHVEVLEPIWNSFKDSPARLARIAANEISYIWDDVIERFAGHALNGTQYFASPGGPQRSEQSLRILAAETRTVRRGLAHRIARMASDPPRLIRLSRAFVVQSGTAYTFLFMDPHLEADEDFRDLRFKLLCALTWKSWEAFPVAARHVGFASTTVHARSHSEDLVLAPLPPTDKERVAVDALLASLELEDSENRSHITEHEYPS